MNFEGGFLLFVGLMIALPILFVLPRLVNWLAGRKLIPLWLTFVLVPVAIICGSLYLDTAGTVTPVKVVEKRETIDLGRNGSWHRRLSLHVEYQPPDELIPAPLTLGCDAATFDALHTGQTVEARVLSFKQAFKFARLKNRSAFSFMVGLFPHTPQGPWKESTAIVHKVTHITKFYRHRAGSSPLRWPYDIVQLNFTPDGRTEAITAVDTIEAASMPNLAEGNSVRITWPQDDPRGAKIVGARPGAPWANWFYDIGEWVVLFVAIFGFLAVIGFIKRRRKRARMRAATG